MIIAYNVTTEYSPLMKTILTKLLPSLYNLALSFLLTACHDTDGCRKNGI